MEAVIPAEMVEEILVRLRVKSLSRFKCVCRSWRALIESRRFIHRHYNHDSNQERLVFRSGEFVEDRFEKRYGGDRRLLLSYFGEGTTNRMGAVKGFVCEVSASGDIVLLNPATHEVKRVPPLPFVPMYKLCFGFGFDPSSGAYKIVVFEREGAKAAWVYNSSSDCWKRGEGVGVGSWVMKTAGWWRRVAFSNGVYYWMIEYNYVGKHILAFDMTSEKFREIKLPDEVFCVSNIAAYGDSIALMAGCHLWVMRKQGVWSNRWAFSDAAGLLLVCMWKDEVLFWSNRDEEFILVNISTREITSVEAEEPFLYPAPFCYKESLVSINGEKDA